MRSPMIHYMIDAAGIIKSFLSGMKAGYFCFSGWLIILLFKLRPTFRSFSPGHQVNMAVKYRLPRIFAIVDPNIEACDRFIRSINFMQQI